MFGVGLIAFIGGITTDKETIMIDNVDVSRCEFYNKNDKTCREVNGKYDTDICDFDKCEGSNCYFKQLKRKTQECEELKERLVRTEEDLKYQCVDCMNVKSDRYRKALEEIEEYIYTDCEYNDGCDRNICIRCDYSNVHDKRILDIINKAKGKSNG